MKGILYLIPVPIAEGGNSGLIYPLLEQTVNSLDEFIVEDLKTARRSLRKIGFNGNFDKSIFHILNEHTEVSEIGNFLVSVEMGKNIGLMSEAGMPCIADPGSDIVRLAHKKSIRVVPLYGQSSIFLALAASGLNGQNFCFHGYLPKSQDERKQRLKEITSPSLRESDIRQSGGLLTETHRTFPLPKGNGKNVPHSRFRKDRRDSCTHIFIETPYRNNHLFEDILAVCVPQTLLCIAKNVTGVSEMIVTRTIADWKKGESPDLDKQPTVFLLGT